MIRGSGHENTRVAQRRKWGRDTASRLATVPQLVAEAVDSVAQAPRKLGRSGPGILRLGTPAGMRIGWSSPALAAQGAWFVTKCRYSARDPEPDIQRTFVS